MLFEKRKRSTLEWIDILGFTLVIVILSSALTFGICTVSGVKDVTIKDILDSVAHIATALAFSLALFQYIKNSKQQRQLELVSESKLQVAKMKAVIDRIETGDNTNLENLNKSLTLLSNLATNFNVLFESMNEDIQKAIVRMHWQDMYFNDLTHKLIELDVIPIVKNVSEFKEKDISSIITKAEEESNQRNIIPVFKKFVYMSFIMESEEIKEIFTLNKKIESLDVFTYHFLNNSNLIDHLYGLMSIVDIRAKAPLLAVAKPSDWALKKESNN